MKHPLRLSLSLAGTDALALASIPFAISPAAAEEPKAESTEAADLGVKQSTSGMRSNLTTAFKGHCKGQALPIKQV